MDDLDRAQEREEELRADALAEFERAHPRPAEAGPTASASHCVLCDEPIQEGRRQALPGVQTCIECQIWLEYELKRAGL